MTPVIARLRIVAEWLEGPRAWLVTRILFVTTAGTFTVVPFVRFLRSGTDMDYRTWYQTGQMVLHGGEIYPHGQSFPFMYPPICALMLAVPAFFGKAALILILSVVNTVAWLLCIWFTSALTSEKKNSPILIASLVLMPFVWSSYHLGQPSLILLALMLGAFLALLAGRKGEILAGALIALASAIKAFPLLAILYLIYRRYWTATISLVAALLVLLLIVPIPFRGLQRTITDARDWQRGMLRYQESAIAQRPARGYSWKNQSIFGVANRLLRQVNVDDEPNRPDYANVINLDFRTVNIVIIACALVVGASFVWVIPRHRSPAPEEFAALLLLILIFTPLTFGYLFVWLMLPLALLIKRVIAPDKEGSSLRYLSIALLLLTSTAIAPRFAQIYGSLFFTALILYLALALSLWHIHFLGQSTSGLQSQPTSVDNLALR
ncbi:MAG TPA: glycosyltransferase family 87 protein [Chthoniobacterales bacterium]|nr:glycosyltransferase family 87 protein [Chthoniobacterales bacterium]